MRNLNGTPIPIPGTINIVITAAASAMAAWLLYTASHAETWYGMLFAALAFSYVGNTLFSMLHEAVHNVAHDKQAVNDWIGRVCAALFPTGFTFQKNCHLSHHRHNRTDHEMFDSYYPNDNKFLKYFQLYCVLTGLYWTNAPTGAVLYLFTPGLLNLKIFRNRDSHVITHMGADAMITAIFKAPPLKTRLEILFTIAVQAGLIYALGITFWGWLACYWAFAMNWGALQYADHAWSDRDIRRGAWNLKVNRAVQFVFLNYHHHLAHHTYPQVPWLHLHKFVDFNEERPSFLKIYLKLWKGPTPATQPPPAFIDPELERLLV